MAFAAIATRAVAMITAALSYCELFKEVAFKNSLETLKLGFNNAKETSEVWRKTTETCLKHQRKRQRWESISNKGLEKVNHRLKEMSVVMASEEKIQFSSVRGVTPLS
jgi:hypothetical protein